jgi:xylose isomerase
MRDIGMTLFVIQALTARGIDTSRTKVNMDWQHLIMNGENLAEYAELLAMQGLLGHQHANSGWGQFDDDNIVGATRFMETLELARALRKVGYGSNGERLGMDIYPYTEDPIVAARQSLLQWRFIDDVAARLDESAMQEAQRQKDALAAYRTVFQALGMGPDMLQLALPPHVMSGTL